MESRIKTEVIDPDSPVKKFLRVIVDGDEKAMIPWPEAEAIADAVEEYNQGGEDGGR